MMARLNCGMSPMLSKSVIESLGQRRICTVIDILQENPGKLASISKLNYKDVITLQRTLIANCSPFPQQGLVAYNDFVSNHPDGSSGIESLDTMLNGGFIAGGIYEIFGMSGVGKTQLCLTLAINYAQQKLRKVFYIDTKGDFSGRRLLSILDARGIGAEESGIILERIHITKAYTFYDLYSFLYHLKSQLIEESGGFPLVIVESLPAIFLQFMGDLKFDGLGLINCLASLIQYIAQELHVLFILVNLATKWVDDDTAPLTDSFNELSARNPIIDIKPALGKFWAHIPNTRMYMEQGRQDNTRKITITKSSLVEIHRWCVVSIESRGVV